MGELFFLLAFAFALVMTGVSIIGIFAAIIFSFVVMIFFGMLGLVFKLLPAIALICLVVWLLRDKTPRYQKQYRYYSRYERRDRNDQK